MHVVAFVLGSLAFTGHAHRMQKAGKRIHSDSHKITSTTAATRTSPHDITAGLATANQLLLAKLLVAFNSAAAFRSSSLGFVGRHRGTAFHPELARPALVADIRMDVKRPLEALKVGSDIEGKIQSKGDYAAFVDVGAEVNAFLHYSDISDEYKEKTEGEIVKGQILRIDLKDRKLAMTCKPYLTLEQLKVGAEIEGTVNNVKDFAAFVDVGAEVKGFLHKSDIADTFVGDARRVFTGGEKVKAQIKAIDVKARKLAISLKGIEQPKEEKMPLETLQVGAAVEGKIVSVFDYGAFVDIGVTANALLHKSDISRKFVADAKEVLTVGDSVKGRILSIDLDQQKLAIDCKEEKTPLEKLEVGSLVEGKIVSVFDYGGFVDIGATSNALLHKSDISAQFVGNAAEALTVGDTVKGQILSIDLEQQKLSIDRKEEARTPLEQLEVGAEVEGSIVSTQARYLHVDIGATVNGIISGGQMSSKKLFPNLTEAFSVGQKIQGRIRAIDVNNQTLELTRLRDGTALEELEVGAEVEGNVTKVVDFGAWVDIGAVEAALLHKSGVSDDRVDDMTKVMKIGQTVTATIKSVDLEKKNIEIVLKTKLSLED